MQGRTQVEAAEALGWPLGTVQVRLHRGRDRLRSRLTRRGAGPIGLAGSGLATSLSATAGVPGREWTEATATAAVRFAAGKGTAGLVAPAVTRLAESALAAMLHGPLKVVALVAIALLLASAALSLTGPSTRRGRHGSRAAPEPAIAGPRSDRRRRSRPPGSPAATVVGTDQAAGSPVRGREGSGGAGPAASRDPLDRWRRSPEVARLTGPIPGLGSG